jgi:Divergent InlB B-repeat domain
VRRDPNGPALAPEVGQSRRSQLARRGASPGATTDRARSRHDGLARGALLALACGMLAMLLLAGTAAAAAPTFDSSFDGSGTPAGSMTPTFVSVNNRTGDVYVIDSAHDAVDVFDATGTYQSQILGSSTTAGSFSFGGGDDIAVDNSGGADDGHIYVLSQNAGLVFAFDSSGNFLWQSSAGISFAGGVAVDGSGNPWVSDLFNGIQELSATDGSAVGSPLLVGDFYANLAFDSAGDFATVRSGQGVDVFDSSGNLLHRDHTGNVNSDVAVETVTNSVYTVDATGITIWDSSGNMVAGTPFGPTNAANSVVVNPSDGKIYITEPGNGRVDIYDLQLFTLGVTVNGTGSGRVDADTGRISGCTSSSGTCSDRYIAGSTVNLQATPDSDSTFTGWTGCDNPSGTTCTVSVTSNRTPIATFDLIPRNMLRLALSGTGSGTVTSAPSGIDCGSTCQASFLQGTLILLTPTAAAGSTFSGWSGGGCRGTGACQITLSADTDVTATFAQSLPTVSTGGVSGITQNTATVSGTVNPNGAATTCTFEYGTSTSYGSSAPCGSAPGSGTSGVTASAALSGLAGGTTYHYRIDASNAGGASNGGDATFTTAQPPTCQTDPSLCPRPTCPTTLSLCHPHLHLNGGGSWVGANWFLRVKCSDDLGGTCAGKVTLKAVIKVKVKKGHKTVVKKKTITVATVSYSIPVGVTSSLKLSLSSAARTALKSSSLVATAVGLDGSVTIPRTVVHKKRKHKKKGH